MDANPTHRPGIVPELPSGSLRRRLKAPGSSTSHRVIFDDPPRRHKQVPIMPAWLMLLTQAERRPPK